MKILVTGATGLVGKRLCRELAMRGHQLIVITRSRAAAQQTIPAPHTAIEWQEAENQDYLLKSEALKNIDAVIHLAGVSIAARRWTPEFKAALRDSRIQVAKTLEHILKTTGNLRPKVMISASAIGYYGDCGDAPVDESHGPGRDFLAQLCQDWEHSLFETPEIEARKVALRIGIVLGRCGGALEKMVGAFSSGIAAYLGSGKQWVSWIHVDDLVSLILESIENEAYTGPINACSPNPVTQKEMTRELATLLHSFATVPAPKPILRATQGQVADALLSSQKIVPAKLQSLNFKFKYPKMQDALQEILGQSYALGFEEHRTQCWVPQPIERVFEFFSEAKNLEAITPPWLHFKILSQSTPKIEKGTLITYQLRLHGIPLAWKTEITDWAPLQMFTDTQLKGPYRVWRHTHAFTALQGGTLMEDRVLYQLPMGRLGKTVAGAFVKKDVNQIFNYRSNRIFELLS